MDITFIGGLFIGALASWGITHWYFKRSSPDQERLYGKLSADVRQAILGDSRERLSVPDLNQLLDDKTIDPTATGDPLPYKACPKCGSFDLQKGEHMNPKRDDLYYVIECKQCGWTDWTQ